MPETITITTRAIDGAAVNFLSPLTHFDASKIDFELQRLRLMDPELREIMLAAEPLLAEEWSLPEEDEAWAGL